jgi:hypothetical protein
VPDRRDLKGCDFVEIPTHTEREAGHVDQNVVMMPATTPNARKTSSQQLQAEEAHGHHRGDLNLKQQGRS